MKDTAAYTFTILFEDANKITYMVKNIAMDAQFMFMIGKGEGAEQKMMQQIEDQFQAFQLEAEKKEDSLTLPVTEEIVSAVESAIESAALNIVSSAFEELRLEKRERMNMNLEGLKRREWGIESIQFQAVCRACLELNLRRKDLSIEYSVEPLSGEFVEFIIVIGKKAT